MMLGELERVTEGQGGGHDTHRSGGGVGFAHTGGASASHGSSSLVGW